MKLLFLTLSLPKLSEGKGGFYADLITEMAHLGHSVYVICHNNGETSTGIYKEGCVTVVRVNVPFLKTNTSLFRKGIGSLLMNSCFKRAYRKYLRGIKFDYVFIPTPPATLVNVVKEVKKRVKAKVYVILRDIQPECADRKVSSVVLSRTDVYDECKKPFGINPIARKLLYKKSQQLYKIADLIGCMSPGNIDFVKSIAPYLDDSQLNLLPNWYSDTVHINNGIETTRKKYNLEKKFVAIFGGNIGPQQAVWNIAQLAKMNLGKKDVIFLVVGKGVKKGVLEEMARKDNLSNVMFLNYMPREDYEAILQIADLGIISLDEKYKVPTCPSKIIGYMALSKPVIAMINEGSDYGSFYIDKPGCGLWSAGLDNEKMFANFEWMYSHPIERKAMGKAGYEYYKKHFSTEVIGKELHNQLVNG